MWAHAPKLKRKRPSRGRQKNARSRLRNCRNRARATANPPLRCSGFQNMGYWDRQPKRSVARRPLPAAATTPNSSNASLVEEVNGQRRRPPSHIDCSVEPTAAFFARRHERDQLAPADHSATRARNFAQPASIWSASTSRRNTAWTRQSLERVTILVHMYDSAKLEARRKLAAEQLGFSVACCQLNGKRRCLGNRHGHP